MCKNENYLTGNYVLFITGTLGFGDGGDEGEEVAAAEELGEEESGVALGFGGVDPVQARPQYACLAASLSQYSASVAAHVHRPINLSLSLSLSLKDYLIFTAILGDV